MKVITLASVAIGLIYAASDYSERFSAQENLNAGSQQQQANLAATQLPQLTNTQVLAIEQAYVKFKPEDTPKEVVQQNQYALTEQEQLAQNGELLEFYQGDWRYQLLAVIAPDGSEQALKNTTAILRATNVKSTSVDTKIESVVDGGLLGHYSVAISNTKQVKLAYKQQEITLLMYKAKSV
ncbi:hypothetical protein DXX93_05655 [Thalassotalea euphylliae]|uniref:Uncharacterized protein n=1 Tax=Thalassotalea euphylliae TaxID=1655234 RepID=A0A3E0TND4_9GAMM|nr:hypothetical protein [Thalassotalea euphylliae]REL26111.1 hypothetical protein DXX93_05655 [Thalassotalea euphylliae]